MTERTYGYPGGPKNMGKKKKTTKGEKGVGWGEPANPPRTNSVNDEPLKGTGKKKNPLGVGWGP